MNAHDQQTPSSIGHHQRVHGHVVGDELECVRRAAVNLLASTDGFVRALEEREYTRKLDVAGSAVGGHVRHLLDHYEALLHVAESPLEVIDYDHRERGGAVEREPAAALERIQAVRARVDRLTAEDLEAPVRVRVMVDAEGTLTTLGSTLGRELAFATHHAVHHHAMMKIIATGLGIACAPGMGLAPSTAKHVSTVDSSTRPSSQDQSR